MCLDRDPMMTGVSQVLNRIFNAGETQQAKVFIAPPTIPSTANDMVMSTELDDLAFELKHNYPSV